MPMKSIKSILSIAAALLCLTSMAQTVQKSIVEDGGSGPYKAEVVSDASLPTHAVYRPQNMKETVAEQGKLPVILYANGACKNDNVQMKLLLNEVVSHGYLAIAIGPYNENSSVEDWRLVLLTSWPAEKTVVTLANGEELRTPTEEEKEAAQAKRRASFAQPAPAKKLKKGEVAPQPFRTYPKQLLEALDWITDQNADPNSEYYHLIDLDKVAVMGQSCGGAQALSVSHDPRIKTCVILNSGFGDSGMQGGDKTTLESLHTPMFYLNGGESDIAYKNGALDYERINNVPIALWSSHDGHNGTYYAKYGGLYAKAVNRWLDWQLKGDLGQASVFYDEDYAEFLFPTWSFSHKNF